MLAADDAMENHVLADAGGGYLQKFCSVLEVKHTTVGDDGGNVGGDGEINCHCGVEHSDDGTSYSTMNSCTQ